ncbi:hypothetical protein FIBSPDRAFT_1046563 [Athelia psychrophila]|uniref:Uncharacterized protein n=1 Tax=Athelia psychrophila TaxID=1759441 RepID=A0A166GH41_9AGAM|nr:hypothetical protein FIBSPDRAFT_1046563 [Fibularhizoctonia sp. CBS 109695]
MVNDVAGLASTPNIDSGAKFTSSCLSIIQLHQPGPPSYERTKAASVSCTRDRHNAIGEPAEPTRYSGECAEWNHACDRRPHNSSAPGREQRLIVPFDTRQRLPFGTATGIPFGATTNGAASPSGAHTTRRTPAKGSASAGSGPQPSLHRLQPPRRSRPSSTHGHGQQAPTVLKPVIAMEVGGQAMEFRMQQQQQQQQEKVARGRGQKRQGELAGASSQPCVSPASPQSTASPPGSGSSFSRKISQAD